MKERKGKEGRKDFTALWLEGKDFHPNLFRYANQPFWKPNEPECHKLLQARDVI